MTCELDHIIVLAHDLELGRELVRRELGVVPEGGGEHPAMGTHNCLLRLGDHSYLEVLAPNPAAPRPARARWFGLDHRAGLPALAAWVVRSDDIGTAAAGASEPLGPIQAMRRGDLEWLITVPEDGRVPLDGVGPALIQWPAGRHPAAGLRDHGLRIAGLELVHPDPPRVAGLLRSLGLSGEVRVTPAAANATPSLVAHIHTPSGPRRIAGRG
jgi:glyoxalase-like protein